MKKLIASLLILLMAMPLSVLAEPMQDIFTLKIDGEEVTFPDQQPYVRDYKLYIPMRPVLEKLGFDVSWDGETQTATAAKDGMTLQMPVGKSTTTVNGTSMTTGTARLENDRTIIRQYVLRNALGYITSWDEEKNELSAMSPEYMGDEPALRQDSIKEANSRWGESEGFFDGYDEFNSVSEKAFVIPGLNEHATPQGLTYRKDRNMFYLSAYFYGQVTTSVIFAVDAQTGEKVAEYYLYKADGTPYSGHVGGIAVSEKDLYIADGEYLHRISLSQIDSAEKKGNLSLEESINLASGSSTHPTNAFVYCADGYLWTGNYHYSSVEKYNKKPFSEKYNTVIRAYKLDASEASGLSSEYKTKNTDKFEYDYTPAFIYTMNEEGIQGLSVTEDSLFISCSHIEDKYGHLYSYDRPEADESEEKLIYDDNKEVSVIHLELKKTLDTIPGNEEIVVVDNNLYSSFESGDMRFRFTCKGPSTDSVWKIDLEKLLSTQESATTEESEAETEN